jgi:hypothetical protein
MKGKQLLEQLQGFGELDVQDSAVRGWIDAGQKEAALDLPVVLTITTNNVVAGTTVSVPTGIFNLISAVCEDGEYPLTSIQVKSASLVFLETADFVTVTFTSTAPDYTNLENELSIHPALHSAMLYYLISMYYDTEGEGDAEESGLAERYYQRWLYHKSLAISQITGTQASENTRNPVETTDVLPRSSRRGSVDPYYE